MVRLALPIAMSLPLPIPVHAQPAQPRTPSLVATDSHRTLACWEQLSLIRREIVALQAWIDDAGPAREQPARWVVESRLRHLVDEAHRLATEAAQRSSPADKPEA